MISVLLFCCESKEYDRVSPFFLTELLSRKNIDFKECKVSKYPIIDFESNKINFQLIILPDVLSHNYNEYASFVEENLSQADLGIIINWHEGNNAAEKIFCIQSTGDMETASFSGFNAEIVHALSTSLKISIENEKLDFLPWFEATHWSGILYNNQRGNTVTEIGVPIIDFEIGSSKNDWENPLAHKVMVNSVLELGKYLPDKVVTFLGAGGTHFDSSLSAFSNGKIDGIPVIPTHLLANQWLSSYDYEGVVGVSKYSSAITSLEADRLDYIVYKDKLKSSYKLALKEAASKWNIECLSHKEFRKRLDAE